MIGHRRLDCRRRSHCRLPGGTDDSADRASVHAHRAAAIRPPRQPVRVRDRARRAAVGIAPAAGARARQRGCASAARRSSAPTASSSRAACCAAMSAAARSSARRRSRPARRSPGAARSRPRRCGRATRRCATRSAIRPTRGCCRSPPASRRSTAFPTEAFQQAIDHVLTRDAHAAWRHGPTEGQPALREAIAERFRRAGRERAGARRRAAGARSARPLPGRSRRRGHHRSARVPRRDSVVPRGRRQADWLGRAARRHRRARGSARPLSAEADLHQPDIPESRPASRCRSGRGASC